MSGLPGLRTRALGRPALWLGEVESTNTYLKARGDRLPHGAVCFTDNQVAGRGRLGRVWQASPGETLALSVLLKPLREASTLPLVAGLAVSRALCQLSGAVFCIKWPNDIVCSNRKVCGILCEGRLGSDGGFAVCGMGMNLLQTEEEFTARDLPYAGSLRQLTGRQLAPQAVAAAILNELEPLWEVWRCEGFLPLLPAFRERCVTVGREVRAQSPDGTVVCEGTAAAVEPDGSLRIRTASGDRLVQAGEVSVRGLYGYL